MLSKLYLAVFVLFFSQGCNDVQDAIAEAKRETPVIPKENYIVLLDLSDRILNNNQQQVAKDFSVVKCIYAAFRSKLNSKDPTHLYYNVNDKLKLLVAPQKTTPPSLYELAGNLRVEMESESPEKKASLIDETEKSFNTTLPEIYRQAVISNNTNDYSGADIWKYFNEDLEDDLVEDGQNTLFIITDGYMDFEKSEERPAQNNRFTSCAQIINALKGSADWNEKFEQGDYGLMPVGKKFPNLRVVLLEINPREQWTGEYNLLTKIWSKWFQEMGIPAYRFIKDDNINEVRESIEKFMQIRITAKITPTRWTKVLDTDSSMIPEGIATEQRQKPAAPVVAVTKKKKSSAAVKSSDDVLPPMETEADLLLLKKKDEPAITPTTENKVRVVKNTAGPTAEGDILSDGTPRKGFNTGIKKEKKKQ